MSGIVRDTITTNGLCYGFTHHPSGIPHGLNSSSFTYSLTLFCAVANGVNIRLIRFQKTVDKYTTPQVNSGIFQKPYIGSNSRGKANQITGNGFSFVCYYCPGSALIIREDLNQVGFQTEVNMVFPYNL